MGLTKFSLKNNMGLLICFILGLVVFTNSFQASFAESDVTNKCLEGNCNQKTSLRRQILEEILAEIDEEELALQRKLEQEKHQVQQRQLREQIQHLMELELPHNDQLIDSLTEKIHEVALICTTSKCARDFVFDKMKAEITKVIEPFTDVFTARMVSLLTPEIIAVNKII